MNVRYHSEAVGYGLQGRTLLDLAFNGDHYILDGVTTRLFLGAIISARKRAWSGCGSAYMAAKLQDLRRGFCAASSKKGCSMRELPSQEQIASAASGLSVLRLPR